MKIWRVEVCVAAHHLPLNPHHLTGFPFHHRRILAIAAALALVAPAQSALPFPAGGKFAVSGGPYILAGAWADVSVPNAASITLIEENQIGSWTQNANPAANFTGVYLAVTSFQCLDSNTVAFTVKGIRAMENVTVTSCSVAYVNATHLILRWLLDPGADNIPTVCPDTPFGNLTDSVTAVYERVEGVVPTPSPLVCKNETTTPAEFLDANPVLPGLHGPKPPPRTAYPQPGGPPIVNGIWKMNGVLSIASATGFSSLAFNPPWEEPPAPAAQALIMYAGKYTDHECLGNNTYRAFSFEVQYYINGTDPYYYSCEVGRRETLANGTTVMYLATPKAGKNATNCPADFINSPDADTLVATLVDDLPWKPPVDCTGGGKSPIPLPSPSPKPSPAPPSGAAAAGLAAIPAALLFLLI